MRAPAGLRRRLIWSLIAVVVLTVAIVGTVSVVLVERSLRNQLVEDALDATEFNLVVLAPAAGLEESPGPAEIDRSRILDRFLSRGVDGVWVEMPNGERLSAGAGQADVSDGLREIVDSGEIGYEYSQSLRGPVLVTAARLPPGGPDFFFVTSTAAITEASRQIVLLIAGTGIAAIAIGSVVASSLAKRMLIPVAAARGAAEQMAGGDLDVRLAGEGADEFGGLSRSFNRMAGSLAETIRELEEARLRERRFVADVSHELRTPLTGLVNEARMLSDKLASAPEASDEHRAIARMLDGDVARLRRLVDDLLEISRLDSGDPLPSPTVVDVDAFLQAVVDSRHPDATVVSSVGRQVPTDPRSLERIVGNLLDNARLHASGAETTVNASVDGDLLVVEVADRGPGVDPEHLEAIFDRFTTGDPARGSGTGLGLAIAHQHANRLGGDLQATLRPGGGLSVMARIPVGKLLHDGEDAATRPPHTVA